MTQRRSPGMLTDMDRNTMIVRLVEALLCLAALVVVVLRLDRLLVQLRELQLHVGEALKISARFFRPEHCTRHLLSNMGGVAYLVVGDQPAIDHLIVAP